MNEEAFIEDEEREPNYHIFPNWEEHSTEAGVLCWCGPRRLEDCPQIIVHRCLEELGIS